MNKTHKSDINEFDTYPLIQIFKDKRREYDFIKTILYGRSLHRFLVVIIVSIVATFIFTVFDAVTTPFSSFQYYTTLGLRCILMFEIVLVLTIVVLPASREHMFRTEILVSSIFLLYNAGLIIIFAVNFESFLTRGDSTIPSGFMFAFIAGLIVARFVTMILLNFS